MHYAELILLFIAAVYVVVGVRQQRHSIARRNYLRLAICFGTIGSAIIVWRLLSQ